MLSTALEVVAAIWAVSGLGVTIWAGHELRRPGPAAADLAPSPVGERPEAGGAGAPPRGRSGTRAADPPVDVPLPGATPRRTG